MGDVSSTVATPRPADAGLLCASCARRQPPGGGNIHATKRTLSPAFSWPSCQIGFDHRDRADKAPEARAIRAEDHRHIAGKINRANGIRVIVNIRRMQPRFAAAVTGPLRFRPISRTPVRLELMHFPLGGEKGRHIRRGKNSGAPCP
jgi:hypothetical protein